MISKLQNKLDKFLIFLSGLIVRKALFLSLFIGNFTGWVYAGFYTSYRYSTGEVDSESKLLICLGESIIVCLCTIGIILIYAREFKEQVLSRQTVKVKDYVDTEYSILTNTTTYWYEKKLVELTIPEKFLGEIFGILLFPAILALIYLIIEAILDFFDKSKTPLNVINLIWSVLASIVTIISIIDGISKFIKNLNSPKKNNEKIPSRIIIGWILEVICVSLTFVAGIYCYMLLARKQVPIADHILINYLGK